MLVACPVVDDDDVDCCCFVMLVDLFGWRQGYGVYGKMQARHMHHGLGVEKRYLGAYSVGMEASRSRSSALLWESSAVAMVFDGGFEVAVLDLMD